VRWLQMSDPLEPQATGAPDAAGLGLEPFPWYRSMRESRPVVRDPDWGGWLVFAYEDVHRVLSDHQAFSSEYGDLGLLHTDPPRHRQLRNLVTEAFTPRTVEALRPRITQIVEELLDQLAPRGQMDLIEDFAVPLPVKVIAELLGIPIDHRERFKRWSDAIVTGGRTGMSDGDARREMAVFFTDLMEERRRSPREDLISGLLAARIDGESLDQRELLSFCILLLVAGNETTTNLIGNAILCLEEHPDLEAEVRAHPELLASTVEEVLRYRSPVQSMFRLTRSEVRLGDQAIPAGEMIVAWIGSANRDPRQFPEPDRFDIRRSPNRHLAFGQGVHFCLGAPLARLEATIALGALLGRLGRLRVERDGLAPLASQVLYGVQRLPVAFATDR
jgi:cytochrome P450